MPEDLYLQVRELQEEVNRVCSIWGNEQDWLFSEELVSQDPQEFQTLGAVEDEKLKLSHCMYQKQDHSSF